MSNAIRQLKERIGDIMANNTFKSAVQGVTQVLTKLGLNKSAATKFLGKFAKPIAFLSAVKDGNEILRNIPIIGDYNSWSQGVNNKLFDSTFGKIPGIGKYLTKISAISQRAISAQPYDRHESKVRLNDPSWYTEHLGIHSNFNIPAAYPDRFPIPVAGGTPRVQAAVFKMIYNPNPDVSTTQLRAEQKFALLKGIRGLSTVNYTPNDIINYEECVLACHAAYYGLKRVVQLAQRYDLMKSAWPAHLIEQLGYGPDDIRKNLAQYKGYLAQCANALHELPITGNLLNKIKFMQSVLFPDSNDATIASYFAYALEFISAMVPEDSQYDVIRMLKFTKSPISSNNLLDNIMLVRSSIVYSYIIADYIGAFGSSCLPSIELDWDTPLQFSKYNEDILTQLQNTDILDVSAMIVTNVGSPDYNPVKAVALGYGDGSIIYQSGENTDADIDLYDAKLTSRFTARLERTYRVDASSGQCTIFVPPVANCKGIATTIPQVAATVVDANNKGSELSVNLPKITQNEGLQLEYIQNKAAYINTIYSRESDTSRSLAFNFNTLNFFCYACTISFTDVDGENKIYDVSHTRVGGYPLVSSGVSTRRRELFKQTLIIQCDWFPSVNYFSSALIYNDAQDFAVANTMDWNIIGVLGYTGFEQAISYTNYSLKAPAVEAGGKTIDNIQEVFNNK